MALLTPGTGKDAAEIASLADAGVRLTLGVASGGFLSRLGAVAVTSGGFGVVPG